MKILYFKNRKSARKFIASEALVISHKNSRPYKNFVQNKNRKLAKNINFGQKTKFGDQTKTKIEIYQTKKIG